MDRSARETAAFIGEVCNELRKLTETAPLVTLSYLLDIAVLEAELLAEPENEAKTAA
jgi:hypothetical protein